MNQNLKLWSPLISSFSQLSISFSFAQFCFINTNKKHKIQLSAILYCTTRDYGLHLRIKIALFDPGRFCVNLSCGQSYFSFNFRRRMTCALCISPICDTKHSVLFNERVCECGVSILCINSMQFKSYSQLFCDHAIKNMKLQLNSVITSPTDDFSFCN